MKITTREMVIFGMLGAVMYASKIIMEAIPNVHLLGVFTMIFTIVYRQKALYPIYTYVLLLGVLNGFASWWVPHLYLWLVLWAVTMMLPKQMPGKIRPVVYMLVCGLFGLLYGTLYAPAQALLFGLGWEGMLAWIATGFPWDVVHGVSNFFCGMLIVPLASLLKKLEARTATS